MDALRPKVGSILQVAQMSSRAVAMEEIILGNFTCMIDRYYLGPCRVQKKVHPGIGIYRRESK